MMTKNNAAKNISLLWVGSLIGAGCSFLTQVFLARTLGPEDFGLFASTFAMVGLLVPLAGFGIAQYWLKQFGKDGWDAISFIKPSFRLVLINLSLVMTLVFFWGWFGPHAIIAKTVLFIMSVHILGQVFLELVVAKLQLEERYELLALYQMAPHLARLLLVFIFAFVVGVQFDVKLASYFFALVSIIITATSLIPLSKMSYGKFQLKGHEKINGINIFPKNKSVKEVINMSWPFGLAGIFHLIYFQSDIILLKYMVGSEHAGYYNVAFTVMVAVLLFPSIVYQKFLLPKMHRWANYNRDLFYKVYRKGNVVMLVLGSLAMIAILLISPMAIPILFGEQYKETVVLLQILSFSAPILFVASSVGATLATQEHMKIKVKLMGVVAIINISLNLLLIPVYGSKGAAIATVISNIILLVIFFISVKYYVFNRSLKNEEC